MKRIVSIEKVYSAGAGFARQYLHDRFLCLGVDVFAVGQEEARGSVPNRRAIQDSERIRDNLASGYLFGAEFSLELSVVGARGVPVCQSGERRESFTINTKVLHV